MRVLVSTSWAGLQGLTDQLVGDVHLTVRPRSSDWGLSARRALVRHVLDGVRCWWEGRRHDVLLICTVGVEAAVVGALHRLTRRPRSVLAYDFLAPRERVWWGLRWSLHGIDRALVLRRNDALFWRRCGFAPDRVAFVPFPVTDAALTEELPLEDPRGYVYAAGVAHRDWESLRLALTMTPVPAVVSGPVAHMAWPDNVQVLPPLPPEVGRGWSRGAAVVALPFEVTDLPTGPLVLLDAMAAGKACVVTDAPASADYVDAQTAAVVPPKDPGAMARQIAALLADPGRRRALGVAARRRVAEQHAWPVVAERLAEECMRAA